MPEWLASVNHKQDLNRQVADVLARESETLTSHVLELIVILLILYEIIAPMLKSLLG